MNSPGSKSPIPIRFGTDGWRGVISDDFTFANLRLVAQAIADHLAERGQAEKGLVVGFDTRFLCPHRPDEGCDCRKPKPGLLHQAADELGIDLASSYLVRDTLSDVQAGLAAGCAPVLILTGRGREELPKVGHSESSGFYLAADLGQSVDLILGLSDRR